jgi:hypothetical protein
VGLGLSEAGTEPLGIYARIYGIISNSLVSIYGSKTGGRRFAPAPWKMENQITIEVHTAEMQYGKEEGENFPRLEYSA